MSDDAQLYAPDYLRAQKDPQLHRIAEMIERQVETMAILRRQLDQTDRKTMLVSMLSGHWASMKPLLEEWSKINAGPEPVEKKE